MALRGVKAPVHRLNDLDLVADDIDVVHATVTKTSLVNHYHPPQPGYDKFLIQLVDPISRLRIDAFPCLSSSPVRTTEIGVGNWNVLLVSLEDQLVRKVALAQGLSATSSIDPKHYQDVALLNAMSDVRVAAGVWDATMREQYPYSLAEAAETSKRLSNEHPEWIKKEEYAQLASAVCDVARVLISQLPMRKM